MKKTIAIIAAATMTVAAPALANAETLKYGDLDLATAEGKAELDRRIHRTAEDYCNMDQRPTGSRIRSKAATQCYTGVKQELNEKMASIISEVRSGG